MLIVHCRIVNIGFTAHWCLLNAANTQLEYSICNSACTGPQGGLETALVTRAYWVNHTFPYQYCEDANGAFSQDVGACMRCLEDVPSTLAFRNCKSICWVEIMSNNSNTEIPQICTP